MLTRPPMSHGACVTTLQLSDATATCRRPANKGLVDCLGGWWVTPHIGDHTWCRDHQLAFSATSVTAISATDVRAHGVIGLLGNYFVVEVDKMR